MENSELVYVGFWKRILAIIIDFAVAILVSLTIIHVFKDYNIIGIIFSWIFYVYYFAYMCTKFGGTVGKLILKMRTVTKDGNYLSFKKALIRMSPYLIVSLIETIESGPLNIKSNNALISFIAMMFLINDIFSIPSNKQKRAIHDRMAGSFVVKHQF